MTWEQACAFHRSVCDALAPRSVWFRDYDDGNFGVVVTDGPVVDQDPGVKTPVCESLRGLVDLFRETHRCLPLEIRLGRQVYEPWLAEMSAVFAAIGWEMTRPEFKGALVSCCGEGHWVELA